MTNKFWTSERFWAMILGSVAIYLQSRGWIGESEMQLIATITAGFVTVRTIDRGAEVLATGKTPLPETKKKKK